MKSTNAGRKKHLASISLDLDNKWSYMKTRGTYGWEKFPSYLETLIPQVLEELEKLKLKITFFVVGQDAEIRENRRALRLLTERGYEVGNHSFCHEPWLHLYSRKEVEEEIRRANDLIAEVAGQKPVGFRGPGFSWHRELFEILVEYGYIYDASSLPTYLGPLARLYYFWSASLSREDRGKRKELFGGFQSGFRPVKPYFWRLPFDKYLLEIPVTTVPFFKMPFHMSYLIYISRYSESLMFSYLHFAVALCKLCGFGPSFLLHPLDFLDAEQVPELAFFPGMGLSRNKKIRLFRRTLRILSRNFELVDMRTHAQNILKSKAKNRHF